MRQDTTRLAVLAICTLTGLLSQGASHSEEVSPRLDADPKHTQSDRATQPVPARSPNSTAPPERIVATPAEAAKPSPQPSRPTVTTYRNVTDIRGHWAQAFIQPLLERNIVQGAVDRRFRPDAPITRLEFATLLQQALQQFPNLARSQNRPSVSPNDVPARSAATVQAVAQTGFLTTDAQNRFNPNQSLTRLEGLQAFVRGMALSASSAPPLQFTDYLEDRTTVSPADLSTIAAAIEKGLVVSYPNPRSLQLQQPLTRAEAAAFLHQALVQVGGLAPLPPVVGAGRTIVPLTALAKPTLPLTAPPCQGSTCPASGSVPLPSPSAQAPSPGNPSPAPVTPLLTRQPILSTAQQLRAGELLTELRVRQSFPQGSAQQVGLTGQPTLGLTLGVTNGLELTFEAQTVDNSGPGQQGEFRVLRINPGGGGPNFLQELTFQAKQRLWQNASGTQALSGVIGLTTGLASRPFAFSSARVISDGGKNDGIVPSLELPFTIQPNDRWQFTLSPKIAFFPSDHILYFSNLNGAILGEFGTTLGIAGGATVRVNPRVVLWGDVFVPFTGNNTIARDSGQPTNTVVFNAGLRYLLNPRVSLDVFASNALGNRGALSVIGDRNVSLGLGVSYLPGLTAANRQFPSSFRSTQQPPPAIPGGFAPVFNSTVPANRLALSLQGGGQGLLSSVRFGLMDDLEIGAFVDVIPGRVDESELGISGKLRFLHQPDGDPFTLNGLVTVGRTNNVLINLVDNDRNALSRRGLEKGGFRLSNETEGELIVVTLSAPLHYQFKGGSTVWLIPTLGFVQRSGLEVAGLTVGGSVPLVRSLNAIAEVGVDFNGQGNAFIGNNRATVIPWIAGFRWQPTSFLGIEGAQFDAYLTNRVGASPFHTLRVRADNDLTIGAGVTIPIQF